MAERRRRGRPRRIDNGEGLEAPQTMSEDKRKLLERCKRRVNAGKKLREKWWDDYQVDALARAEYGVREEETGGFRDPEAIWINKFDPTLKTILPSLFFNAPQYRIDVIKNDSSLARRQQAKSGEALLNRIVSEDRQLEIAGRLAIRQSMRAIGVVKLIYDPTLEPNPSKGLPIYETDDAGQALQDDMTGQPKPLLDEDGNPIVEPNEIVKDETYKICWVNAENMILPPKQVDPGKWQWIAEEVTVSVEEARKDKRFKASLRSKIKTNVAAEDQTIQWEENTTFEDEEDGDFKYIEYYDLVEHRYYAWADGTGFADSDDELKDELLIDEPIQKGFEDHCYCILLGYTPILDPDPLPWPLPLTYNWLPIEREHNLRRNQLTNAARHSARKVFFDQNTFPDHEQAANALQSNTDMEAVLVNDVQRVPIVQADPPPSINLSADLAALEGDWARATGLASSAFGTRSGSATEAKLENQAGDVRESDLRRVVTMFFEDIGRKMFNLMRATMTVGVMVKMASMTDRELGQAINAKFGEGTAEQLAQSPALRQAFIDRFGNENWLEVNREDITFDADITVVPGSMKSRTLELERQQFLEFMQIVLSSPIGLQSRELLNTLSNLFEFIDDALVEELVALGEKSAAMEAQKAGRYQGDDQGAAGQAAVQQAAGQQGAAAPQPNGVSLQSLLGAR